MSAQGDQQNSLTPLMRQYHAVKQQHPDKILLFRMGDFYEMFGDDAVKAAPILGIALTSRAHGNSERIPLAGVPYHAVDRYLARLLAKGEKVVVVEQVEDPKTAKGIVKREIVEIVTPGTATIDLPDPASQPLCLAALFASTDRKLGIATLDLSTGAFQIDEGPLPDMVERLRVAEPSELLFPSELGREHVATMIGVAKDSPMLTTYEDWNFDLATARRDLNNQFGTATLDSFGVDHCHLALTAAGAIVRYLKENHREKLGHLTRLNRFEEAEFMTLDYSSVRNLELVRNLTDGGDSNTLLSVVNFSHTAAGARRLRQNLLRPFRTRQRIETRLSGVTELVKNRDLCGSIREKTKQLPDLEKLNGRLGIGRLNPRQMVAVRDALTTARTIKQILADARSRHLADIGGKLPDLEAVIERIGRALVDDPPVAVNKGGMIRPGFSDKLDQLNDSIREARLYIGSLQKSERERTGIATLKVGFNQVFGYYIEVTRTNSGNVPNEYIRKQTLVNAERYITPELKEKEELILAAEEKINRLEGELFQELIDFLNRGIVDLILTAELLAEIDLVSALAELAINRGYCCPTLFDDTRLTIVNGRHPVIEAVLPPGSFVANDIALATDTNRMLILTGPNMSGKSTYLRQIGLIVILAQIGSYVPADTMELGLVDRVFTRVGALDNLARGQSTFLVEMVETANIINNATEHSLILLDEVGRGTSTFDGLSVAWSVVEHLNEHAKARTVFATHYHELTGLAEIYPTVHNFQVSVKKWEDKVVFLHKIIPGGCDDSYGIEVAKLAGLPRPAINRAKQILRLLESGKFTQSELGKGLYKEKIQTTLFEPRMSEVEKNIAELDLDQLSPVQAFDLLRRLKERLL
ncbi:MAG: DNA mismatch repair protein MutS [Candidatus Zixiibacteriota bacterium]